MDWKYVVATTLMPMHHSMQFEMRSVRPTSRMNARSPPSANIRPIASGHAICTSAASVTSAVVIQNPSTSAPRTRP